MTRILVINPNCSEACTAGISAAVAPLRLAGGPAVDVVTLREGPPAILTWRDWHAVVEPMCRLVERDPADVTII
ncbi:MAG TPA: aspartate/glutamate racemase family protein, partial [Acetobacteraceae bacterium]